MTTAARGADPVVAAQTARNLALARRLVEEAMADAAECDPLPEGASLVLLPYDDPALGVLNLGLANRRVAAGEVVHLQRVGVPDAADPFEGVLRRIEAAAAGVRPRWPVAATGHDLAAYDPAEDLLVVNFFGGLRQANAVLPINPNVLLLIDQEANEVVGRWVPNFAKRVRIQDALMGELLLLSFAKVDGLTGEEAARLRDEIGFGVRPPSSVAPVVGLWNLDRLIA